MKIPTWSKCSYSISIKIGIDQAPFREKKKGGNVYGDDVI